jgi:hypothetical protein
LRIRMGHENDSDSLAGIMPLGDKEGSINRRRRRTAWVA